MLNYDAMKNFPFPEGSSTYSARDAMIYALGVGFGEDPLDERQLRFVTEQDQVVAPTMPVVFCHPGLWIKDSSLGMDWRKLVHASQRLVLHSGLAPAGTVAGKIRNVTVADRGEGKGAVIVQRREIFDESRSTKIATVESTYLARGDGGFSAAGKSDELPPRDGAALPARKPDHVVELATRPDAALLYRLSGDYNPLHSSPAAARAAGFQRPILHGLCTFGVAARGLLGALCDYNATGLSELSGRFSAPVLPGETVRLDIWTEGRTVLFRAVIPARDNIAVLQDGMAVLSAA
jgi:acyl dehydratase